MDYQFRVTHRVEIIDEKMIYKFSHEIANNMGTKRWSSKFDMAKKGQRGIVTYSICDQEWSKYEERMQRYKFRDAERVKLSPTSNHRNQCTFDGVIVEDHREKGSWVRVHFDNGYSNIYMPVDLVAAEKLPKSEMTMPEPYPYSDMYIYLVRLEDGDREIVIHPDGIKRIKEEDIKPRRVQFTTDMHNIMAREYRIYQAQQQFKGYPRLGLFAKNRYGIICAFVGLHRLGGCGHMPGVEAKEMIKKTFMLQRRGLIPCGMFRVGSWRLPNENKDSGATMQMWTESPNMFVLSLSKDGISIQTRGGNGKYIENIYAITNKKYKKPKKRGGDLNAKEEDDQRQRSGVSEADIG